MPSLRAELAIDDLLVSTELLRVLTGINFIFNRYYVFRQIYQNIDVSPFSTYVDLTKI